MYDGNPGEIDFSARFEFSGIDCIANIYMLQIGLFMFSFKNKLLPVGLHDMFLSSSQLHSVITQEMPWSTDLIFPEPILGNLP